MIGYSALDLSRVYHCEQGHSTPSWGDPAVSLAVSSPCLLSSVLAHRLGARLEPTIDLLILDLPPVAIIPDISGPEHAVQQPPSDPIRAVLAVGGATVEERAGGRAGVAPDLEDGGSLALGTDMVPEERGTAGGVVADAVEEVGFILVHSVVDEDYFVLGSLAPGDRARKGGDEEYPHCAVVLLVRGIKRVEP